VFFSNPKNKANIFLSNIQPSMEPEPSTLMLQLVLQKLGLTMPRDISAHRTALEELNTLKSTILDLKNKKFSLNQNGSLCQIADLTASSPVCCSQSAIEAYQASTHRFLRGHLNMNRSCPKETQIEES
jgi:hypothetical protein